MRLSLSLRILICESTSAKRSFIVSISTRLKSTSTFASRSSRSLSTAYARAFKPLSPRLTNTRAMSSSAAEVPASGVKAETCEVKPTVNAEANEPVIEKVEEEEPEQPKLPSLSAQQFREFNRMADHMDYFIWTMMYTACENKKRPAGMSIRGFLDQGLHFVSMLTTHHSIEEAHVFPMLAKRMPEFQQPDKRGKLTGPKTKGRVKAAELVKQHRDIHKGMDAFEDYLRRCRNSETELEMSVLKAQMDTWGTVLWQHLNEEVAALGAENMRKYWTIEEVRRMRM